MHAALQLQMEAGFKQTEAGFKGVTKEFDITNALLMKMNEHSEQRYEHLVSLLLLVLIQWMVYNFNIIVPSPH